MKYFGVASAIYSVVIWLLLVSNTARADEPSASAEPVVMPVELFFKEMQLLARRVPVGNTKLEQEDSLEKLREEIHTKFDGVILEFDTRIESVDWRNDLATIRTQSPIRKYNPSARLPFNLTNQFQPLAIPLSREATSSLNTRKPLKMRAKLKFIDGGGVVAKPPTSQSVFVVRSENYKQVISVGTFITEDYSIFLGDEEVFATQPDPRTD